MQKFHVARKDSIEHGSGICQVRPTELFDSKEVLSLETHLARFQAQRVDPHLHGSVRAPYRRPTRFPGIPASIRVAVK